MTRSTSRIQVSGRVAFATAGLVAVALATRAAEAPGANLSDFLFDCRALDGCIDKNACDSADDEKHRSLFNGKDLAGWEGAGEPAEKCWKVEDGTLLCTGARGPWLRSKEQFDDFNLRFEYQVSPEGNSGVYVRVPTDGNHHRENDNAPPAGFEVQILDDAAPKYKDLKDYQFSGSVYDIAGATRRVSKPAGLWNTLEINARGQRIAITHNGVVVVDLDEDKFPLIKLRQTKGFLGLQNHSTLVKFRKLRIGPPLPF